MSDAYGTITFCTSKDAIFDKMKLLEIVNSYKWGGSDEYWEANDDEQLIWRSAAEEYYPTAFPWTFEYDEGIYPHKEYDFDENYLMLYKKILSALSQGWIEFACTCSEGRKYNSFQRVRISSDGKVIENSYITGPMADTRELNKTTQL
jgi:hypothetical protein